MPEWVCENCNAIVDEGFDVCWQCGASKDGETDPEFFHERDVATLPPGTVRTIRCRDCGYKGSMLIGRHRYALWEYIVGGLLSATMLGTAPVFIYFRITQSLRFNLCPKCRRSEIEDWEGKPIPANEAIAQVAQAEVIERFNRQRLQFLCVVLGALLVPAVIMLAALINDRWTSR